MMNTRSRMPSPKEEKRKNLESFMGDSGEYSAVPADADVPELRVKPGDDIDYRVILGFYLIADLREFAPHDFLHLAALARGEKHGVHGGTRNPSRETGSGGDYAALLYSCVDCVRSHRGLGEGRGAQVCPSGGQRRAVCSSRHWMPTCWNVVDKSVILTDF